MVFPNNKKFAFTIIDDTDGADVENISLVYEFLKKIGIKATKTVWALLSRDTYTGLSLENYRYRQFIKKLERDGFEIAFHSAGSGRMTRQDILDGLAIFRQFIGYFPKIQINHGENPDNIYWGIKRFSLLKPFWRFSRYQGDNPNSAFFWGDEHKKHVKYTRNFTFRGLNTTKHDKFMPYLDSSKEYANFWFSSSDGSDIKKFNRLITPEKIDRLKKSGGATIIYTHFANGFVRNGRLDRTFQRNMQYLASLDGYFATASELLDYLEKIRGEKIKKTQILSLELKWVWNKLLDKVFKH